MCSIFSWNNCVEVKIYQKIESDDMLFKRSLYPSLGSHHWYQNSMIVSTATLQKNTKQLCMYIGVNRLIKCFRCAKVTDLRTPV